ncbi:MAG: ACP S-malonyltransferase [Parachlamydiales bacterium]|nr:ACP S-malonyltransferase [Parachlamydiales bacterium]
MKKFAFIFPGQGSQYIGMGKDFFEKFESSKKIFILADEILGYKLSDIIFNGPEQKLVLTKHCQLAVFVNSAAILKAIEETFPKKIYPIITAGLSLGEYTALYAAKKISFKDALLLIQKRADLMTQACLKNKGTMAAVIGMEKDDIHNAIKDIKDVFIANLNTPLQTVISGSEQGVDEAIKLLKEKKAKRVIKLDVEGAFHSLLMKDAEDKLKDDILNLQLEKSQIKIVMNYTGDFVNDLENIKRFLIKQITSSVKWYESIEKIDKEIDMFIEIGCGKTLTNMNKKIKINSKSISIEKVEDLDLLNEV